VKIDLDENYAVEFDGIAFQLQKKRVVTGNNKGREAKPENIGKVQTTVDGYYGTLAQALKGYRNKDIGASEIEGIELILDLMEAQEARLDAVFGALGDEMRALYKKSVAAAAAAPKKTPEVTP